jgi:hypothetical protein
MQRVQNWHRRHAIQIVAQLPESTEDALKVLELSKRLVEEFLGDRQAKSSLAEVKPLAASASSR